MSARKVSDRLYASQVDFRTATPSVYRRGSSYRVLTRPDGKRKVMRRFDTYAEAVAFKDAVERSWPKRAPETPRTPRTSRWIRSMARDAGRLVAQLRVDPCCYCGAPAEVIDHIVPIVAGGPNTWENLTSACAGCNSRKRSKSLLLFLAHEHGCWEWRSARP